MILDIKKLSDKARMPFYATALAAAFDIFPRADWERFHADGTYTMEPNTMVLVPTGLEMHVPLGYCVKLYARSGNALKSRVSLQNAVGVIDADYRGEVGVLVENRDPKRSFTISSEKAIAQGMFEVALRPHIVEVNKTSETARGTGGFGHTDSYDRHNRPVVIDAPYNTVKCTSCNGAGKRMEYDEGDDVHTCAICDGSGRTPA